MVTKIIKAKIGSTKLGLDDRFNYFLTFWLFLEYKEILKHRQGFGGVDLNHHKIGSNCLKNILETVGVSEWKELKGKKVRIETDEYNNIIRIGNRKTDKWYQLPD